MAQEIDQDVEEVSHDLTEGYCVKFYVWPDGSYSLGEPVPIDDEEYDANEQSDGEHQTDLTSALKRLINIVKQHPVGSNDEEQFSAGYAAGPGGGGNAVAA